MACYLITAKGGNSGSFKKGLKPWNKGRRGVHLSPATEFKKGGLPPTWRPVGTITIRIARPNNGRRRHPLRTRMIKVAEPRKWMEYARYIWTKKKGGIPKGMIVTHKDFDSLNDDIENLALMNRAQHIDFHKELLRAFRKNIIPKSLYAKK